MSRTSTKLGDPLGLPISLHTSCVSEMLSKIECPQTNASWFKETSFGRSKPVANKFGEDFVDHSTKANRMEIGQGLGYSLLADEHNNRVR